MATISSDSYSISPSYVKYSKYLYNNKKLKANNRKPIFAPILEEPSNIMQNLQELNTSSIPITNNNNNNSSFENSINGTYMVDYHTMNKFRPSLNLSCLPPVFEIPRKQINDNNNLNNMLLANNKSLYNEKNKNNNNYNNNKLIMKNSRLNLRPIVNNNLNTNNPNINVFNNTAGGVNNNNNLNNNKSNFVSLPPINSHTNYNNIYNNNLSKINNNINYNSNKNNKNSNNSTYNIRNYNQRKRQYLKPIQYKNSPNPSSYGSNNNETKRTIDAEKQGGSYGKKPNQGKYYYNLNNKNIIKSEKLKEERVLRHKEMSNISINQNKNYVDKNIVIKNNNTKGNNNITNNINSINNINIEEYIEINRNKSRVIHIPTLKIYNRCDIPFKNWNLYEKYIKNWTKMMRGVLEIKAVIENNELNCFSIIIERSKNCSLGDLLKSIGSINEYIIISIVKQIIPLIQKYNSTFDYRANDINEQIFNYVDIDNIWFNEQYNVVLFPGKLKFYSKNENLENFMKKIFETKNNDINNQINIDLMNFGITLINMNIFLLDISVEDLFKLIKKGEEEIDDICCLFHYFCKKIKFISNFYESFKSNISNEDFNQNYFDFLHNLTIFKRDPEVKNIIEHISNHPFIMNSTVVNENANINELIKLSKTYDFSNEYYTSNANIISFDLITKNIRKRLPNYESFFSQHNIFDTKTLFNIYNIEIEELCRELRVNEEELHDKLLIFYENMLENKENNFY